MDWNLLKLGSGKTWRTEEQATAHCQSAGMLFFTGNLWRQGEEEGAKGEAAGREARRTGVTSFNRGKAGGGKPVLPCRYAYICQ